jgi:hypothetical protein
MATSGYVTYGGFSCLDPGETLKACVRHNLSTDWYGKPSPLRTQVGANPGRGWLLMARGDVEELALRRL